MKRKLILSVLTMLCVALCTVGFVACDSNDKPDIPPEINTPNANYISKDELYFASGCDYTVIENYFKENGIGNSSYTISSSKDYGAFSTGSSIKYTPADKEIQVIYAYTENQSDSYTGILYQYT